MWTTFAAYKTPLAQNQTVRTTSHSFVLVLFVPRRLVQILLNSGTRFGAFLDARCWLWCTVRALSCGQQSRSRLFFGAFGSNLRYVRLRFDRRLLRSQFSDVFF